MTFTLHQPFPPAGDQPEAIPAPMDRAMEIRELVELARPLLGELILGRPDMSAATVAAAIRTKSGRTYTGVCIHVSCGIGFCAEHAAIAEMIKGRETQIDLLVVVCDEGILSPCGRCRELMVQIDPRNLDAQIALPDGRVTTLRDLLPEHWLAS